MNTKEKFDIQEYMTKGVERVVADAVKATLKNPKESAFMVKFAAASKIASEKRKKAEKDNEHRPPFLIKGVELITGTAYEGDQQIKINPWDVAVLEY